MRGVRATTSCIWGPDRFECEFTPAYQRYNPNILPPPTDPSLAIRLGSHAHWCLWLCTLSRNSLYNGNLEIRQYVASLIQLAKNTVRIAKPWFLRRDGEEKDAGRTLSMQTPSVSRKIGPKYQLDQLGPIPLRLDRSMHSIKLPWDVPRLGRRVSKNKLNEPRTQRNLNRRSINGLTKAEFPGHQCPSCWPDLESEPNLTDKTCEGLSTPKILKQKDHLEAAAKFNSF